METISIEKLRAIARRIHAAADDYQRIADAMDADGIKSLKIRGFGTLEDVTLSRLESPIGSARRAMAIAITETEAQSDVAALEAKVVSKRTTKKGKS